jgi:hypothetical protein
MQENSDRTDVTLFTPCVRYGLLGNDPRSVAGLVFTTVPCKCIACILKWFMKKSTSFGDMPPLLLYRQDDRRYRYWLLKRRTFYRLVLFNFAVAIYYLLCLYIQKTSKA